MPDVGLTRTVPFLEPISSMQNSVPLCVIAACFDDSVGSCGFPIRRMEKGKVTLLKGGRVFSQPVYANNHTLLVSRDIIQ